MQIFIHRNNQQLGPFTEAEIKAQLAAGAISLQDHIWWQGQSGWMPLRQSPFATPVAGMPSMPPVPFPVSSIPSIPAQATSSQLALWAVICGLGGLLCGITMIPAIILGHLALSEIKRNPALKGRGMAITALIIGYLWLLIVVACVGISVLIALGKRVKQVELQQTGSPAIISPDQSTNSDQPAALTNSPDQTTNSSDSMTNSPDQSTNSTDQTTNSSDSMTNSSDPGTNGTDQSTNSTNTNSPDTDTNSSAPTDSK
jgi:hypothetical protein